MKICFLGDSITEGAGASSPENNFINVFQRLFPCEAKNFGVGGTRIARQIHDSTYSEYYLLRAQRMDKDADFIYIMGGTNDYGHGDAPIGQLGDTADSTFYGAMNNLCDYLAQTYGKDRICFLMPLPRYKEDSPYGEFDRRTVPTMPLEGYREIEREILHIKNIRFLETSSLFPIPLSSTADPYTVDGLHPNDKGHRLLAEFLLKDIKENYHG